MTARPIESPADDPPAYGAGRAHEQARLIAALDTDAPLRSDPDGRLALLAERFGLDPLEVDMIGLLWCCAIDPPLRDELVAADGSGQMTLLLATRIFGDLPRPRLSSESPLLQWQLVREHERADGGAVLTIDPMILAWLDGTHELDRALAGRARILTPGPELTDWPVDRIAATLRTGLQEGRRWRLRVNGSDMVAARWFAAAIGRRIGLPVLEIDPGSMARAEAGAVLLHRQAFLDGCIPFLAIADVDLTRPAGLLPYPLQIVHGTGPMPRPGLDVAELDVALAPPGPQDRERLWRRLWPASASWPAGALADLALCHEADVGDIAAVAAACPDDADAAASALRERLRHDSGSLTRRIDCVFQWSDLVLPAPTGERLGEIAFEARERIRLWSEPAAARLFPYGRGLVALFAGPPGTGKTMAAQVIAADLGLDLLAVDLSAIVSKWVGETAQNLQQLLSARAAQRSILFFDEADALYAKRVEDMRDAHDRYANHDSSHLMTALEAYPGIVILATNLKANIDSAFLRRIRHVVDFARPDEAARAMIWRKAVQALFPRAQARRLAADIDRVARIEASGALIKNAALSAAFAVRRTATPPNARLLADMLARELGKEGAGLSPRDLEALIEARP